MKTIFNLMTLLSVALLVLTSCQPDREISPTKGTLKCYVDESLFKLINDEREAFIKIYPESKIELVKVTAREGITAILNGKTRLFISSRELNEEEKKYCEQVKSEVRGFKFCYDAVVPIVSKKDAKEKTTLEELKKILSGQTLGYNVFIPGQNSGVYEYLKLKLLDNKEPIGVSIVKNEREVIKKIENSKKFMGFVGLNSIKTDSDKVKILDVAFKVIEGTQDNYYKPYVAYLLSESYPLVRTTAIFLNDIGAGLASGFATFLTDHDGQKVVADNNLGPATVPVKMVELNRR
jgi:ABC-type phosphate transport system substrate-binding protein